MNSSDPVWKKLTFGVKLKKSKRPAGDNLVNVAASSIPSSKRPKTAGDTNFEQQQNRRKIHDKADLNEVKNAEENHCEDNFTVIKGLKLSTEKLASGGKSKLGKLKQDKADASLNNQQLERIRSLRRSNRIFVWGEDIVNPILEFDEISHFPQEIREKLLGNEILRPTPVQMQAIPIMQNKRELLVSAPTGSGKTLAFVLPILTELHNKRRKMMLAKKAKMAKRGIFALILEPTRELAKQTYIECLKYAENLTQISCGLLDKDNDSLEASDTDILVSTPNRLLFLLKQNEANGGREGKLLLDRLRWLVVDESDRLFDKTESDHRNFRDQLGDIYQFCERSKLVKHAFFSATFSYEVEEWCKQNLNNLALVCVGPRNSAVDTVHQELLFTGSEQGKMVAVKQLFRAGFEPPALIFVQSKHRARQLYLEIAQMNIVSVDVIHADRSREERDEAVKKFRLGKTAILICTELLGRGIDFKGVNLVVNFDLPTSAVSYIHRIGRTGRAGQSGKAVTYFTASDMANLRPIANVLHAAGCPVPEYALKLQKPSRKTKKFLLKKAPKRKNISTLASFNNTNNS